MLTEGHARAAELDAVIHAIGEGLILCSLDGTVDLANPASLALFPAERILRYGDLLALLHDPQALAPGLGQLGGPVELATRADPERWIELSTYPVGGDVVEGQHPGTVIVLRDVTESRRRDAIRELFIGVLSHELRTPVTTIYGGAQLLARKDSTLDEAARQDVFRDILEETERLHRLVEDVVALNRFGESGGDIGADPVLVQRLLPRVVSSEEARWPGVAFRLSMPPGLHTVVADETYVEQVCRNLLSNAAKYGGPGATIDVVADSDDDELAVRVLDDGPGLDPAGSEHLFELFYRSSTTAMTASGAGIGLYVCARLIRAMRGRIWAVARPGGGAEFGFALPVLGG